MSRYLDVLHVAYQISGDWQMFPRSLKRVKKVILLTLTCICCKILEHSLVSNINQHLAFDSILTNCQHGSAFRGHAKSNWSSLCTISSATWMVLWIEHKQTDLIIMDFTKAFDKVPHRRLLHNLDSYGIIGSTHKWINSWPFGCIQQVVSDDHASDPILSSVSQGSVWVSL